jgi:hypothetical protein
MFLRLNLSAHPVYKNWYTAAQIRKGHLEELEFIGFKSVIKNKRNRFGKSCYWLN